MDSTVIQEIANQLGLAVDQAGTFVFEHLPAFAGLKMIQLSVPLALAWVFVGILAIAAIVSIALAAKARKERIREADPEKQYYESGSVKYAKDWSHYDSFKVFCWSAILCAIFLFFALIATALIAPNIIGWMNYPDAMLLDMAIKAVG